MTTLRPILVVDDDPAICLMLQRALSAEGYEVLTAHNGLEAFNMLTLYRISLIILDMRMPIADGWKFLDLFCDNPAPNIPIIAISAMPTNMTTMKCVNEFFSKPYNIAELVNCVRNYVKPVSSVEVEDTTNQQSDSSKSLEDLRQKIVALREEVAQTGIRTAEAEETLQTLNKLIERIEARKQARVK
jgi:DNA-binding response OmpR family regulator